MCPIKEGDVVYVNPVIKKILGGMYEFKNGQKYIVEEITPMRGLWGFIEGTYDITFTFFDYYGRKNYFRAHCISNSFIENYFIRECTRTAILNGIENFAKRERCQNDRNLVKRLEDEYLKFKYNSYLDF